MMVLNSDTISVKGKEPQTSSGPSWRGFASISGQDNEGPWAEPAFQSKSVTGSTKDTIKIILLFLERIQETLDLTAFR